MSDTYVISIKPEFANKIYKKEKMVEFRKVIPKEAVGSFFFVYSSAPEKKVICMFKCTKVITDTNKEKVWKKTKKNSGITKEFFDEYFKDKDYATALVFEEVIPTQLGAMERLDYYGIKTPPQNYAIAFKNLGELKKHILQELKQ